MLMLYLARHVLQRKRPVFEEFRRWGHEMTHMEYYRKKFGNREQVGYGCNGEPGYFDKADLPFPSIRYMENSGEILALRYKERGDWKKLTVEEKKLLYRASFCQTFSEFQAPTGEWKWVISWTTIYVCAGIWIYFILAHFVYKDQTPKSFSYESRLAQARRAIDMHHNPITGISSKWDYEKREWKDVFWSKPRNPFKDECGEYIENVRYDT